MSLTHIAKIAQELSITAKQVEATITLLDEGGTVPFISRYRKEVTGSLDEVAIAAIRDRIEQLRELDKRRETILKSISDQGKLTPELETAIHAAETMAVLEDIYLPYKPKKRTRATIAKEKGLEPLADIIFEQQTTVNPLAEAEKFVDAEKQVASVDEALAGARDIIAERVNENAEARAAVRDLFWKKGTYSSKVIPGKEEEAQKYKDYFEWSESVSSAPSHRVLAMRRGEKEGFLLLDTAPEEEEAIELLERQFIQNRSGSADQVKLAVKDSYRRLLKPSMETEIRLMSKKKADEEAIRVFADNLRNLLMAAPMGERNILAIDPGFRTGCKVVCLNRQGKLLHNDVIYPEFPNKKQDAIHTVMALCARYEVEAIAIGNGTAGRETESFVRSIGLPNTIQIVVVNESGASIYSASDVAREEFPDYDVTVRGAVSIGRRLMDPLAELVKIDPKSIGVGQYQHDVDQSALKQSLDDVVMSSVNAVGVEVNTASKQLLTYVSGLGPQLAQNIIDYRNTNGPFKTREELKKVPRLGSKAFEQAAGFLRIRNAENPLDSSAVHPERYDLVNKMATDLNSSVKDLMKTDSLRKQLVLAKYQSEEVGLPTLQDIVSELAKPGRDPREQFETFQFADGVNSMEDLRVGMKLPGIVTNVAAFGAFVDIGVHQDGLVHISELSDKYVSNPNEVVKVQQKVEVTVMEVDIARKRIALSLKTGKPIDKAGAGKTKERSQKNAEPENDLQTKLAQLRSKFK
ncbi:Tex family protein [Cytophagaceae bacterium DM2B3-1]|uniref:Tex family protein n=1 Tax=Xanthocytophaga flava TaxID=3048013 RepID=A0ABT7CXB4_9BACT|nr:Tex family protein [Xanthocytophaga flavus]MDJ1498370.1 Tex family protein [Xanthocytophaga flavus]